MSGASGETQIVPNSSLNFSDEDITVLIYLLELAETEIHRRFKRLSSEDLDMKEINFYYRYQGRKLRKMFREMRGY